jgi:hypothetical protein
MKSIFLVNIALRRTAEIWEYKKRKNFQNFHMEISKIFLLNLPKFPVLTAAVHLKLLQ